MTKKPLIALLRGINVGGRVILPMAKVRTILAQAGLEDVQTYIQSGNVVFWSDRSAKALEPLLNQALSAHAGRTIATWVLTPAQLEKAMKANPFPDAVVPGNTLHVGFCRGRVKSDAAEKLEAVRGKTERFHMAQSVCYLSAPDGIARSKLAASLERWAGVPVTMRNWRTLTHVLSMVAGDEG